MSSSSKNGEPKMKKEKNKSSIGIIFRYADWTDNTLMIMGTIGAIGDGMSTNCLLVYVSHLFNSLGYGKTQSNHANFMIEVEKVLLIQHFSFFLFYFILFHSSLSSFSLYTDFFFLLGNVTVQFILCVLGIGSNGGCIYG